MSTTLPSIAGLDRKEVDSAQSLTCGGRQMALSLNQHTRTRIVLPAHWRTGVPATLFLCCFYTCLFISVWVLYVCLCSVYMCMYMCMCGKGTHSWLQLVSNEINDSTMSWIKIAHANRLQRRVQSDDKGPGLQEFAPWSPPLIDHKEVGLKETVPQDGPPQPRYLTGNSHSLNRLQF